MLASMRYLPQANPLSIGSLSGRPLHHIALTPDAPAGGCPEKITRNGTPKDDRDHDITSGLWKSSIVLYLDLINIPEIDFRPSPYADVV
jgi:hypothetical protein